MPALLRCKSIAEIPHTVWTWQKAIDQKVMKFLKVNLNSVAATGKRTALVRKSEMKEKHCKIAKGVFH